MVNYNPSALSKLICVDLGCGKHKAEGFIGVDVIAGEQVDIIANLNGHFPFPNNSVDFIKVHNVVEHLPDRIHTMNEIWRICKPDAIVDISVPSTDGRGAFQDPNHVSFWNVNSFMYYCREFPGYLAGCQSHYGFKGEFSIVSIEEKSVNQVIDVQAVLKVAKSKENTYQINLRDINLIVFPDWNQSIEILFEHLANLFKVIINHPESSHIALLIDTQNTKLEDAEFFISDILMNLYYEENIESDDNNLPEFNLLNINSLDEYKGLLPVLSSRIILNNDNEELINQIVLEQLPSCNLEELKIASLAIHSSKLLDKLPYIHIPSRQKESSLSKADRKFAEQKFNDAVELYRQAIIENPQFAKTGLTPLAHSLVLTPDWQEVSRNLPPNINYLETSGWLNSLYFSKPVNQELKPIPWYTYPTIEFIENKIDNEFRVFEYGSGNSSLWWAERVTQVVSIESNANWFKYIKYNMPSNVELYLIEDDMKYASAINQYEDDYFDVIIVDGINRNQCAEFALSKVKEQGFIIFDNTDDHRYVEGVKKLLESGFIRIDFYGMIPSYLYKNCTSIFFKDIEFLTRGGLPSEKRSCLGRSCFQITSPVIAIEKGKVYE
ncbi:MAG: methyltransferase domain-containing protein [Aulosira sp. DedQUE10]|nr:methyltransferase domain-containing protein [Aulosira sp. DedQUE10]